MSETASAAGADRQGLSEPGRHRRDSWSWITAAPVYNATSPDEVSSLVLQARQRILPAAEGQIHHHKREFYQKYDEMLTYVLMEGRAGTSKILYYYFERPLGFCVISENKKYIGIDFLVGDIDVRGVGKLLIEAAVNYSEKRGKNGLVELVVESEQAEAIYRKCGFKGDSYMTLDPRSSDAWSFVDGRGWVINLPTPYDQHVIDITKNDASNKQEATQSCVNF